MSNTATTDQTNTTTTNRPKRAHQGRTAAAVVAIAIFSGTGGFVAGAQQPSASNQSAIVAPSATAAMNRAVAQFAVDNNLTGLSPASLGPEPAQTLAQFARENGLTGLSPASLAPIAAAESTE